MAKVSVADFIDYVHRSRVVRKEDLQASLRVLSQQHNGKIPRDLDTVANHLVANGIITDWQSQKIQDGKYRGFQLGKYILLGHLGSGGMSTVYLAEHTKMRRRVAIKVLPPKLVGDSSHLDRFYREAQSAAALDHPNIVRAYDIDSSATDLHYLVMEFVPGSDLKVVCAAENQPLDIEQVVHYTSQAAAGLQHAHEAGLVHRDIKPANLLVEPSHQLKILDLGLALTNDETGSLTEEHDEKVFGTADYLAPEQAINSHNVDARVDIYALGCTFYYALLGHAPFPTGTLAQRIAQHQSAEPTPLGELRPDCPPSLVQICQRMMRKDPNDRYRSAGEVHQVLVGWLAERKSVWSGAYRSSLDQPNTETQPMGHFPSLEPEAAPTVGEMPIVVSDSESRLARHRGRKKQDKRGQIQESAGEDLPASAPPEMPAEIPTATPVLPEPESIVPAAETPPDAAPPDAQPEFGVSTDSVSIQPDDTKPILAARRERSGRAKKPPVGLWVFLAAMIGLAILLAIKVAQSG